jgi:hypothetical protein
MLNIWSHPCGFDFSTRSADCEGNAGDFAKSATDELYSPTEGESLGPSLHVPLALFLQDPQAWLPFVRYTAGNGRYDDPSLYAPVASSCSIHSPFVANNPTQLIIGFTNKNVTVDGENFVIRLPDKSSVLQLAFALDMHGISPSWLLGLAAASSRLPLVPYVPGIDAVKTIVEYGDF